MTHFKFCWFVSPHWFDSVPIFLTQQSLVHTTINEKFHIYRFRQLLVILDNYFHQGFFTLLFNLVFQSSDIIRLLLFNSPH